MSDHRWEQIVITLDNGPLSLTCPSELSSREVDEVEAILGLWCGGLHRRAKCEAATNEAKQKARTKRDVGDITSITVVEDDGRLVGIEMVAGGDDLMIFADQEGMPWVRCGLFVAGFDKTLTRRTIEVLRPESEESNDSASSD